MLLEHTDTVLFFHLHRSLMFYANQRLKVIPGELAKPEDLGRQLPKKLVEIRDAVDANLDLIDSFVDENPAQLSHEELEIVHSWRDRISGDFYICRELKNYAVFLSVEEPAIAYGVRALSQPLHELVGRQLPALVKTVLLPFKGQIIYDGLMSRHGVTIGPGLKRSINEELRAAKRRHGIVTSLPMSDVPLPVKPSRAKLRSEASSKKEKDAVLQVIIGLIEQFCNEHLNEEYAELCRRLAEKLARKRPSPLLKGSPNAWASGIVRAVGGANFLHDKSQTPYMRATDIDRHLGVSSSSGASRLAEIRKIVEIHPLDPQWTLPSRLEDNPLVWMLEFNGFVIDVRKAPRKIQELAYLQGQIPYIPADRDHGEDMLPDPNL